MSNEPIVTMMFPANVMKAWPKVALLLQEAIDMSGTHNIDDVRKKLLAGHAQLWVQWNEGVEACAVTEFVDYPRGLWLRVWLAGADDQEKGRWAEFQDMIVEFAMANDCIGVENWGRKGWEKLHAHLPKCKSVAVIYRYNLGDSL